jgi:hypothetical protein
MPLRVSCLVHLCILVMLIGCAVHKPVAVPGSSQAIMDGRDFVARVDARMPQWDADQGMERYERVEIATVKADIAMATEADTETDFLRDVAKLHEDWDKLCVLDQQLQREFFI